MKDLKIEYRDGQLVEFSIDGIVFNSVTAIGLSHEIGATMPSVSMSISIGSGKTLVPSSLCRQNQQIIEK
ncbi:serine acetyltransferase [Erwinia sp. QL-Z3]|uniref:serine acetyltransferase n=1 Tax=Erwinia sp. QL-Z3 TaxID=2547962 RepID=UPI0010706AA9|nr:serine acetyltransferase [Erwinia sp. QL-Z3]QBR52670.1 serine acetyltransferase [Erwinia sp. QL-Z3]